MKAFEKAIVIVGNLSGLAVLVGMIVCMLSGCIGPLDPNYWPGSGSLKSTGSTTYIVKPGYQSPMKGGSSIYTVTPVR